MNAGDIIKRWQKFEDDSYADKLFICLSDVTEERTGVFVKTTSVRKNWRVGEAGCFQHNVETYYVVQPNKVDWFPQVTFVQFYRAWLYTQKEILTEALTNRNYEQKGRVSEQTLSAIINCFKTSPDISQEIKDIVEQSRKARKTISG